MTYNNDTKYSSLWKDLGKLPITTDSRNCPKGSIFIALKGDNFNGNQFALQALEKGCAYAIVDEDLDISESQISKLKSQILHLRCTHDAD